MIVGGPARSVCFQKIMEITVTVRGSTRDLTREFSHDRRHVACMRSLNDEPRDPRREEDLGSYSRDLVHVVYTHLQFAVHCLIDTFPGFYCRDIKMMKRFCLIWFLSYPSLASSLSTSHTFTDKADLQPLQGSSRRLFLNISTISFLGSSAAFLFPSVSLAESATKETTQIDRQGKPFAPPSALLPAARFKLWIDQSYAIGSKLSTTTSATESFKILEQLNQVLSNRPKLFRGEPPITRTSSTWTAQLTTPISGANKEQYQRNRSNLSIGNQVAAMLNQADVERQWGMLQSAELAKEQSNEMRAALNYYTQQLEFGDSYLLTASKMEKKQMIRNDALPTLTAVITSDLDLRELYRNQWLTAVEDWQAEVAYQVKSGDLDTKEVLDLMNQVYAACEKWFELISPEDVQVAMNTVSSERK